MPGAAALGRDRVIALRDVAPAPLEDGALCVPADAPLPLSAGG
ncbi:MAG TPA: hypothetical protein VMG12_29175 [Polyangiaceae bacterium]|nr:hypothetical protein [Polyangiaceae bacterium]